METINLKRIWELVNKLSSAQDMLHEQDKYVYFLGGRGNYMYTDYNKFLDYYSFQIQKENICIHNNDFIPYEDYTNNDFNYLPIKLLQITDKQVDEWIEEETEKQLKQIERDKITEKEEIKQKIKRLEKQLEQYGDN